MAWPHVFSAASGSVPASFLDDNFNAAAELVDLTALEATVTALPSNVVPLAPVAGGLAGVAATTSRNDHQHPPQGAVPNTQTGTSYTLQASDDGKVVELSNAASITVTVPNSLAVEFSCLLVQAAAGQVTIVAGSGATQHAFGGLTKTAGQWAMVTLYVRANAGSAAEYVLGGNMIA